MPRRRGSNVAPRARLISTPSTTYLEGPEVTSTIAGVKFSDKTAALLDHAAANGFRIEAQATGGRSGKDPGVVLYAPDKDVPPFPVYEVRAKFNPSHYDNIKSGLMRAGMPPLPSDRTAVPDTHIELPDVRVEHIHSNTQLRARLKADQPDRGNVMAGVVAGMFQQAEGGLSRFDGFAASLIYALTVEAESIVNTMSDIASTSVLELFEADLQAEKDGRAAEKKRADAAIAKLEAADAKADKARADCAAALRRAEAAEAAAAAAEAVLAPMRGYFGGATPPTAGS